MLPLCDGMFLVVGTAGAVLCLGRTTFIWCECWVGCDAGHSTGVDLRTEWLSALDFDTIGHCVMEGIVPIPSALQVPWLYLIASSIAFVTLYNCPIVLFSGLSPCLRTSCLSGSHRAEINLLRKVYSSGRITMRSVYFFRLFNISWTVLFPCIIDSNWLDAWWCVNVCRKHRCNPAMTVSRVQSLTSRSKCSTLLRNHSRTEICTSWICSRMWVLKFGDDPNTVWFVVVFCFLCVSLGLF